MKKVIYLWKNDLFIVSPHRAQIRIIHNHLIS